MSNSKKATAARRRRLQKLGGRTMTGQLHRQLLFHILPPKPRPRPRPRPIHACRPQSLVLHFAASIPSRNIHIVWQLVAEHREGAGLQVDLDLFDRIEPDLTMPNRPRDNEDRQTAENEDGDRRIKVPDWFPVDSCDAKHRRQV